MAEQKIVTRRSFFAGIGLVAAAGAAVKLSTPAPGIAALEPAAEPVGGGYRLTEHIKKYYRTTII